MNEPLCNIDQGFHTQLLKYLSADHTIREFLDHCEELLGYPVWIMDAAYNLIETSRNAATIWETAFAKGTVFEEMIHLWKKEQFFHSVSTSRKPMFHTSPPLNSPVIVSDIYIHQERIAKFTAFPMHADESELGKAELICTCIAIMMQKLNIFSLKEDPYTQLLYRLLQSPPISEHELHNYVIHGNLTLADEFQIVIICDSGFSYITQPESINYELGRLSAIFPNCIGRKEENHLLLLLNGLPDEEQIDAFSKYLAKEKQSAFFSNSFRDLTMTSTYHQQAMVTMRLCLRDRSSQTLHYYHSIYLTDLISRCDSGLLSMCMPEVLAMVEYDSVHATDYFHTCDVVYNLTDTREEAAHQLNLHLNTIKYRLAQMEALFGFKITTYHDRVYFTITSEIIKAMRLKKNPMDSSL